MTRKALIKTADLLRMANVAKKYGVVVEQEFEGVIVRVAPHRGAVDNAPPEPNPWDLALDAPPEPIEPPFDHREQFAMERLIELGVGVKTHSCTIRSFGPHTQNKLLERGYVEVAHQPGGKFKDDEISLTKKGLSDWRALEKHRGKYWSL